MNQLVVHVLALASLGCFPRPQEFCLLQGLLSVA